MEGGQVRTRARNSPTYFRSGLELKEPGGTRRGENWEWGEGASGVHLECLPSIIFCKHTQALPSQSGLTLKNLPIALPFPPPQKGYRGGGTRTFTPLAPACPVIGSCRPSSAHPLTVCEALEGQHGGNKPELRLYECRSQHH